MKPMARHRNILPDWALEKGLDSIPMGATVYVVPWALHVDPGKRCWLHSQFTWKLQPLGTAKMKVQRQRDGWHVWLKRDHHYTPLTLNVNVQWLPVILEDT